MRATVSNFRGCEQASLDIDYLTLIAGHNGAGKSSLLGGIVAAVSGNMIPLRGVAKGESSALVKAGADRGLVVISDDDIEIRAAWPTCRRTSKGDEQSMPTISAVAAGLEKPSRMSLKELSAYLAELLEATPSMAELEKDLISSGVRAETAAEVCERVSSRGWDAAEKHYRSRGAEIKGAWEAVTGERYGSAKAETWLPAGWSTDCSAPLESLSTAVDEAKRTLERAIGNQAVAAERLEDAKCLSGSLQRLREELAEAEGVHDALYEEHNAAAIARPLHLPSEALPCPHCGKPLQINGGTIQVAEAISDAERKEIKAINDQRAKKFLAIKAKYDAAFDRRQTLRQKIIDAQAAEKLLASTGGKNGSARDVDAAREVLASRKAALEAAEAKRNADRAHATITEFVTVVKTIAPDGLRARKSQMALTGFNETLRSRFTEPYGMKAVSVDPDMTIRYGGRDYRFLSVGEQWYVDAVLAVACAHRDGSWFVILDGADTLVSKWRQSLFEMLNAIEIPALVGMSAKSPESVPDLADYKMGQSYWMESGILKPLSEAKP